MASEESSISVNEEESGFGSGRALQTEKEVKILKKETDKSPGVPTLEEKLKEDSNVMEDEFYDEIFIPNPQQDKKETTKDIKAKSKYSSNINDSNCCLGESSFQSTSIEVSDSDMGDKSEVICKENKLFSDVLKGKVSSENNETNSHNNSNTLSCITSDINALHMVTPVKKTSESENTVSCPVKLSSWDCDNDEDGESDHGDDDGNENDERPYRRQYNKFESVTENNKVRKRFRDLSGSSGNDFEKNKMISPKRKKKYSEPETDPIILARRQKQIDYGKNSLDYDRYIKMVPKQNRRKDDPKTPPKHVKYSRRAWDGLIKIWKQQIHAWNNSQQMSKSEQEEEGEHEECELSLKSESQD